jgi:hypothetical protein
MVCAESVHSIDHLREIVRSVHLSQGVSGTQEITNLHFRHDWSRRQLWNRLVLRILPPANLMDLAILLATIFECQWVLHCPEVSSDLLFLGPFICIGAVSLEMVVLMRTTVCWLARS